MTYQNIDTDRLKASVNIVDIIGGYLQIKKTGSNYTGLCPFHSEKSPSFSVSESKQMYYCFGCGATGDAIKFIAEYSGCEFIDACKTLDSNIQTMPSEKVKSNVKRAREMPSFSTPIDDRRDSKKSHDFLKQCNQLNDHIHEKNGQHYIAMIDHFSELVNVAKIGPEIEYIAGGLSYGAFGFINKNSDKNIAVTEPFLAFELANKYNHANILICFDSSNLRYVCDISKPKDKLVKALITGSDDDAICYDKDFLIYKNGKLERVGKYD